MAVNIIGESKLIQSMIDMISKVAPTQTSVLIIGESGTGKELVARMIHEKSQASSQPFVPVNCGAIPENLIESELFGHTKGSFTGAVNDKRGLFEVANQGTLFLDEIGELPLSMQVKLLRALQEKTIRKVGGNDDIRVNTRILAATNRNLEDRVKRGEFREDLYYRLNVIQIKTPPLRERKEDIPILADTFLSRCASRLNKKIQSYSSEAMSALKNYPWPGNVRELENVVERSVALEGGDEISLDSLPDPIVEYAGDDSESSSEAGPFQKMPSVQSRGGMIEVPIPDFTKGNVEIDALLNEVEREYLLQALDHAGGVKKKAAGLLGITFRSMRYRLKKLGMSD